MDPTFPSFRRQPPDVLHDRFRMLPLSVMDSRVRPRSGLRLWLAGSPQRPAESRSSSYGPMVHLRLLPTSPHGDAVTFSYRPESACLGMTSTSLIEYTFRRTGPGPLDLGESLTCSRRSGVGGWPRSFGPGGVDDLHPAPCPHLIA